ncbi:MAG: hypothetical protein AAF515_12750 [Pseudomonadota bacterium]
MAVGREQAPADAPPRAFELPGDVPGDTLARSVNEQITAWLTIRGLRDSDARPLWQDIAEDLWRSDGVRRLAGQDRRLLEGLVTLDIQRRRAH